MVFVLQVPVKPFLLNFSITFCDAHVIYNLITLPFGTFTKCKMIKRKIISKRRRKKKKSSKFRGAPTGDSSRTKVHSKDDFKY